MPRNADAEKNNPCLKEQELTYKCLNDNAYDRDICSNYFVNYRNCKDFWGTVQSDRRQKGLRPLLPHVEDRAEVKREYLKKQTS